MSFENFESGADNEAGANAEVVELLTELDQAAAEAGEELADTDFIKLGPTEAMQLQGRMEMILSALGILVGLTVTFEAMPSWSERSETIEAFVSHLARVATSAGGAALFFGGVNKFAVGYKRFLGYIRMKELRENRKS